MKELYYDYSKINILEQADETTVNKGVKTNKSEDFAFYVLLFIFFSPWWGSILSGFIGLFLYTTDYSTFAKYYIG